MAGVSISAAAGGALGFCLGALNRSLSFALNGCFAAGSLGVGVSIALRRGTFGRLDAWTRDGGFAASQRISNPAVCSQAVCVAGF